MDIVKVLFCGDPPAAKRTRASVKRIRVRMGRLRTQASCFLALLAIALQCFLVQVHVHRDVLGAEPIQNVNVANAQPARQDMDGDSKSSPKRRHDSRACDLCQQSATNNPLPLADAALLCAPSAWVTADLARPRACPTQRTASHIWQSRAPPSSLA